MNSLRKLALAAAVALLLTGCSTLPSFNPRNWFQSTEPQTVRVLPSAPDTASAPLNAQLAKAQDAATHASEELKQAQSENSLLLAKLKANVTSAAAANAENPEGIPRVKVAGELSVADGRLDGVTADPVEVAAAAQRALLVEQGKTLQAQQAYQDAVRDSKAEAADLATEETKAAEAYREQLEAEDKLATATAGYEKRVSDNEAANTKRLQAVEDSIRSAQVRDLNLGGGLCVALLALGVGFGGLAGLRMTYPFGIVAAVLFGLAQVVGSLWFHYCLVGGLVVAVISAAYYLFSLWEAQKQHAATTAQLAQTTSVLHSVVPVLDTAYDSATPEVKQVLDDKVFTPLATTMDRSEKALVETIRTAATTVNPAASAVAAVTASKPTVTVTPAAAAAPTVLAPAA